MQVDRQEDRQKESEKYIEIKRYRQKDKIKPYIRFNIRFLLKSDISVLILTISIIFYLDLQLLKKNNNIEWQNKLTS